jgi:hypothetical protein
MTTKKKQKYHDFDKKRYRLIDQSKCSEDIQGYCNYRYKEIAIPLEGDTKNDLDTIVHESLHACFPHISEKNVWAASGSITSLLWRLGWRQKDSLDFT